MLKRFLRRVAAPAHDAVTSLDGVVLRADVRSLGRESRGGAQIRGNGTLALSQDSLHFYRWKPWNEVVIPLADIVVVDTAASHAGKRVGATLLRVRWREQGGEDVIAWQVPDLEDWIRALDAKG